MSLYTRKGWKKLNKDFARWFKDKNEPQWPRQREWLHKELIKRKFVDEDNIDEMWLLFKTLTERCSDWNFQNKILCLITLCLDPDIGESIDSLI
jgi:hypothetical protein